MISIGVFSQYLKIAEVIPNSIRGGVENTMFEAKAKDLSFEAKTCLELELELRGLKNVSSRTPPLIPTFKKTRQSHKNKTTKLSSHFILLSQLNKLLEKMIY